jgi:hypothetical protein
VIKQSSAARSGTFSEFAQSAADLVAFDVAGEVLYGKIPSP